jgi:hypothetical protein
MIEWNDLHFNGFAMNECHVFNLGKYVGVMSIDMFRPMGDRLKEHLYQTAFVYVKYRKGAATHWWRPDGTPRTSGDVPKDYIAMAALLG